MDIVTLRIKPLPGIAISRASRTPLPCIFSTCMTWTFKVSLPATCLFRKKYMLLTKNNRMYKYKVPRNSNIHLGNFGVLVCCFPLELLTSQFDAHQRHMYVVDVPCLFQSCFHFHALTEMLGLNLVLQYTVLTV